ncbi:MarR family winged helix-turn-helix transcriptional regulator [Streptomyces paludis]|uniref:MarR family transcriptional regulator n=1 Tax=Streptomyces paludis TaxID=2282738 RepID=A0A345HS09_9ACTN|nr:MarR family transcriptional regulator [Streptomyces paludis]AXG79483.1 MarR family transcriptional regulator [Streptomyces paludis]
MASDSPELAKTAAKPPVVEPGGPGPELLGTRLRLLLDRLEAGVAAVYTDLGMEGFRPRYTPVARTLAVAGGPRSIRELAAATGVTHSAASQTVAQMAKDGLVTLTPGEDARRRLVELTPKAEALLPALNAEWAATTAAATALEAELPYPLSRLISETLEALDRHPMRNRIASQAQTGSLNGGAGGGVGGDGPGAG